MKPGDLYKCSKHSLLLFPTTPAAVAWAAYWFREFSCRVTYIPAEELFMILTSPDEKPNQYGYHQFQVLYGETVGWINWKPSWMKLEKVK